MARWRDQEVWDEHEARATAALGLLRARAEGVASDPVAISARLVSDGVPRDEAIRIVDEEVSDGW